MMGPWGLRKHARERREGDGVGEMGWGIWGGGDGMREIGMEWGRWSEGDGGGGGGEMEEMEWGDGVGDMGCWRWSVGDRVGEIE